MEAVELLRKLSEIPGPPGLEDEVKNYIKEELSKHVDRFFEDKMGNLYAYIENGDNKPTVVLAAHMDEVGLMVTHIDENGFLRFTRLGGIDPRTLYAQRIILLGRKGPVKGYIGAMPPHLITKKEDIKVLEVDELVIDVGASSKDEVLDLGIELGTKGVFDTRFGELTSNRVAGKAFDDRVGVASVIATLKAVKDFDINLVGVFTVQEEVGLRGARSAGWNIDADYLLVLECTAAGDIPGVSEHMRSTELGKGVAITLADASIIAHPKLVDKLVEIAKNNQIPFQFKTRVVGGTDGGAIHTYKGGIPTAVLSVPGRYIHSPQSIVDKRDHSSQIELVKAFVEYVAKVTK